MNLDECTHNMQNKPYTSLSSLVQILYFVTIHGGKYHAESCNYFIKSVMGSQILHTAKYCRFICLSEINISQANITHKKVMFNHLLHLLFTSATALSCSADYLNINSIEDKMYLAICGFVILL